MEDMNRGHYLVEAGNEDMEKQRLENQHEFFVEFVYGGRLIRNPNIKLPEDANILDSGTGSGIWLLEFAPEVPHTTQLYGIDIATNLFPQTMPPNVQFLQHSVTALPSAWDNKFHFIHQRALGAALLQDEWPVAIAELFRVLVPREGRVQLLEVPRYTPIAEQGQELPSACTRFASILGTTFTRTGHGASCSTNLPRYLEQAGFVDIQVHTCSVALGAWGGEAGLRMKEILVAAWLKLANAIVEFSGDVTQEECLDLIDAVGREIDEGPQLFCVLDMIEARKPMENE